jgi:hypothetical protein
MTSGDTDRPFDVVLNWLLEEHDIEPVPAGWVPGARPVELRRLAALGGLVNALVGLDESDGPHPAFVEQDLRAWLAKGPKPSEMVILAGKQLLENEREDGLARLYGKVVSPKSRRTLGTFFTAPSWVQWMVNRWAEHHSEPAAVVDVGAGVGIFTTVAASQWPNAQVWSIDINPITLGLLALRVHDDTYPLLPHTEAGPGLRVIQRDFTVWMESKWSTLPQRRLILGNPPYTRLQLLPIDQRERLWKAAGGLCGRRASLSALITAMSLNSLEAEDGICLLLPAQWLESDYARDLRSHIASLRMRRTEVHLFDGQLFRDAQVDAVALMVGPEARSPQPLVFSHGDDSQEIDRNSAGSAPWRYRFDRTVTDRPETGHRLGEFLTVRRGVATGANKFFAIPDSAVPEATGNRVLLTPLVRRLNGMPDRLTVESIALLGENERYWLITAPAGSTTTSETFEKYVERGKAEGYHLRHLCQSRRCWYDLCAEVFHPDLIIGQSTKSTFRILENEARVSILNNMYGMTWKAGVGRETRVELVQWLRSSAGQSALSLQARIQGEGLKKIEPRALEQVRVPARFRAPQGTLA